MLFVSGILLLFGLQGELNQYRLEIDPVLLDSLYANPYAHLLFPAFVETEAGSCSCMAGFRGNTSLNHPKKSWQFELQDISMLGASHVLLDAQYLDQSTMRNALALYLTRRLGRPASLTEHVELYINNVYFGVYIQVERIDEYLCSRNNLGAGAFFKSVNKAGRFVWQPAHVSGTNGFESRRGSEGSLSLLRQLIDAVNLQSPLSVDLNDYLAHTAVTLAIVDNDAMIINYFLFLGSDGIWRTFPWDRDITFGNSPTGDYQPGWIDDRHISHTQRAAMAARLLAQSDHRDVFDDYILQAGLIMEEEFPQIIDSIYYAIRASVYLDTLKSGTNSDFDDAVAVLREAVIQRGQFISALPGTDKALVTESMVFSDWDFPADGIPGVVTVTISFREKAMTAYLCTWTDGAEVNISPMNNVNGYSWTGSINFPGDFQEMHFAVKYRARIGSGVANSAFYYPLYGPPYLEREFSAPTVRRSAEQLVVDSLQILTPVRYTTSLWSIPIVNTSTIPQDISFCGFQVGSPPARLHTGADVLIMPGDTMYLTNNKAVLEVLLPSSIILGDLIIDSPANTHYLFLYPSWETAIDTILGDEVSFYQSDVVLNELMAKNDTTVADNYGDFDDWIEIANRGSTGVNLSGYYLSDNTENPFLFAFPDTVIQPGDHFIVWADNEPFQGPMHAEFNLNSSGESLYLQYSLLLVDQVTFPELEENISYGRWPDKEGQWKALSVPSPGATNQDDDTGPQEPRLQIQLPNPVYCNEIVTILGKPGLIKLEVYDLAGRLVDAPFLGEVVGSHSFSWDSSSLTTGIYFLRLTQSDETMVQKITVIN